MYQIIEKRRKTENKYNAKKLKEHGESIVASNIFKGSVLRFYCSLPYKLHSRTRNTLQSKSRLSPGAEKVCDVNGELAHSAILKTATSYRLSVWHNCNCNTKDSAGTE